MSYQPVIILTAWQSLDKYGECPDKQKGRLFQAALLPFVTAERSDVRDKKGFRIKFQRKIR